MARAAQMQTLPAHSVCWQPAVSRLLGTIGEGAEASVAHAILRVSQQGSETACLVVGHRHELRTVSLGA